MCNALFLCTTKNTTNKTYTKQQHELDELPPRVADPPEAGRRRRGQINVHLRPTEKHPRGQSVDILGINRADRGRHCEETPSGVTIRRFFVTK